MCVHDLRIYWAYTNISGTPISYCHVDPMDAMALGSINVGMVGVDNKGEEVECFRDQVDKIFCKVDTVR